MLSGLNFEHGFHKTKYKVVLKESNHCYHKAKIYHEFFFNVIHLLVFLGVLKSCIGHQKEKGHVWDYLGISWCCVGSTGFFLHNIGMS